MTNRENIYQPSDAERERVGKKFAELAAQLRANQAESDARPKFKLYTDAELRAFYPAPESTSEPAP